MRSSWATGRFLDDANRFPAESAVVTDVRLDRRFGALRVRFDVLNVTDGRWEPVGYVLPDFTGAPIVHVLPPARRASRLAVEWSF